jgi:protein-tyrosine phosphatase
MPALIRSSRWGFSVGFEPMSSVSSTRCSMTMVRSSRRHVTCDAAFNLRDLGGYAAGDGSTVRWGTLYRADALHRTPEAAVAVAAELGWRTVVDLRTPAEQDLGRFESLGVTVVHLPVLAETWDDGGLQDDPDPVEYLTGRYLEMLDVGAPALRAAVEVLASTDRLPAVFHCSAGKDRTGVLAALVLSVLGVAGDDIAEDYHLSAPAMDPWGPGWPNTVRTSWTAWPSSREPCCRARRRPCTPSRPNCGSCTARPRGTCTTSASAPPCWASCVATCSRALPARPRWKPEVVAGPTTGPPGGGGRPTTRPTGPRDVVAVVPRVMPRFVGAGRDFSTISIPSANVGFVGAGGIGIDLVQAQRTCPRRAMSVAPLGDHRWDLISLFVVYSIDQFSCWVRAQPQINQ